MSKSIYEKALEIIDRNFEFTHGYTVLGVNDRTRIVGAILKAQKQERLLELYNRLFNVCEVYKCASIGLSDDSEFLNVMSELEEHKK